MSVNKSLIFLIMMTGAAAICPAFPAASSGDEQIPGTVIRIDPQDLPAPYGTPVETNHSQRIARPSPPPFRLPDGFSVNVFADGLAHARWMTVAPNGDVLLAESAAGKVTLLRDADGDGAAETVTPYATGFMRPHGVAVEGDWLYVADVARVWRVRWDPAAGQAPGKKEPVTRSGALGSGRGHWTRSIVFDPDGRRFHVTIGSRLNIGREPAIRASVQTFDADGSGQSTYAAGLRNPVGIAIYPGTADLYVVVNERDGMGDGLVPDYLTRLAPGGQHVLPNEVSRDLLPPRPLPGHGR
jgi:glucose/arabinose dehydrogenase